MFENTLATLGVYLADKFELPKQQVAFVDKEIIFNFLSLQQLPLTLPAISYFCSDFNDPMEFRPKKVKGEYNHTFTAANNIELIPINLTISISLLASNLDDYFKLMHGYWRIVRSIDRSFNVEIINDPDLKGYYPCVLKDHSSLTTPPGGTEGRDFDRGLYFMLEGSFTINSFALFEENYPVIRKIQTEWHVNYQQSNGRLASK